MELHRYIQKLDMEVNRFLRDCDTASEILRNGDYQTARRMLTDLRDRDAKFSSHFPAYRTVSLSDQSEASDYLHDCCRTVQSAKLNLESLFYSYGHSI